MLNKGDRVRPSEAAVKRDRKKPAYDYSKRSPHTTGTIVAVKTNVRGNVEYKVRWDTTVVGAFTYSDQWQSPSMLQLEETNE
jgi:hypothetical protein